ncbi:hypothetical protein ACIRBY_16305 [Streptomyces sp. NPDC096136]|uniref:hypothetical protein n=1 Tax=Streptomyces sp. NPDC096136 TaxID=3366076 RepID=UPI00380B0F9B
MPTYEALPRFAADLDRLTPEQRRRFRQTVAAFVEYLRTGRFRDGLRETREFPDSCACLQRNPSGHRTTVPGNRQVPQISAGSIYGPLGGHLGPVAAWPG